MEGMIKDLNAQNKATYEGMVKDIRLNTENRKITLTDRNGEDTGNGIVVKNLSAMVAEDMTGKDPEAHRMELFILIRLSIWINY